MAVSLLHVLSTHNFYVQDLFRDYVLHDARTANQLNKVPVSQASSHTRAILKSCMKTEITEYTEVISHQQ